MQVMVSFMMDVPLFKKFLMVREVLREVLRELLLLVCPQATLFLMTDVDKTLSPKSHCQQLHRTEFQQSDHGESSILNVVVKDMIENGFKKCG